MIESLFAALGLTVCVLLLLRMGLGPAQRQRFDAFWQRRLDGLRRGGHWLQRQWRLLRASRGARREAEDLIGRARNGRVEADRDGNVIRPRRFGGKNRGRDDRTLH
jgi:hypothetical protein